MTASLVRFLPDFEMAGLPPIPVSPGTAPQSAEPAEPAIDLEAERARARAEGEAAARAELTREHAAEREAAENRHAAELAALRAELESLAAQAVPQAVTARTSELADLVAGDVAQVLAPLIDDAISTRILAELSGEIRAALELDNAGQITLTGPEGLMSALRDKIGADDGRLTIRHADHVDIEVEIDRTRFETRLAAWAKALQECLA
ncbi:hypothetical protein [uncultured Hoeflea sp.]|uniref:hypothetical protein n=1 Tax=uncultured Hoeflea sp. TaxID=538666 RepID=UPI00262C5351|nr:hypothetical protein [uncultured Hoeflea sp.]